MATPTNGSITVPAGTAVVYAGRVAPVSSAPLSIFTEPALPEHITLRAPLARALAAGSAVTLQVAPAGSGLWRDAAMYLVPGTDMLASAPTGVRVDHYAGGISDLTPGVQYDVRVSGVEPGVGTWATAAAQMTTRALPAASGAATKTATPANVAAQLAGLVPGDVLELTAGTYGALTITASGTEAQPIYIRGASRDGVIVQHATQCVLIGDSLHDVVLERMTLQGSGVDAELSATVSNGVFFGNPSVTQARVTLRGLVMTGVDRGVCTFKPTAQTLVYDCTLTGNNPWASTFEPINPENGYANWTWSDHGINFTGTGNAAFNNSLTGFGDCFRAVWNSEGYVHYTSGVAIYRNDVQRTGDDLVELDGTSGNALIHDNVCRNAGSYLSADGVRGGPVLFFRNRLANTPRHPFKLTSTSRNLKVFSNTIARTTVLANADASIYCPFGADNPAAEWANNLILDYGSQAALIRFDCAMTGVKWDYNAIYPSTKAIKIAGQVGSQPNWAAAKSAFAAQGWMVHDVQAPAQPFAAAVTLPADYSTEFTGEFDCALAAGSALRNVGVAIPGITDGFSGGSPDIGAVISGRTPAVVGDRTSTSAYGVVGTLAASLAAGAWLEISGSTNVSDVTDTSVASPFGGYPAGTPIAWLRATPDKPLTNWPGNITWDSAGKRVIGIGCSNGFAGEGGGVGEVKGGHTCTVFFDVTTGQFTKQWNPFGQNSAHFYDSNSTRPLNGYIYRRPYDGTGLYRMDLATKVWTLVHNLVGTLFNNVGDTPALEVHPTLGAQGSVLICGGSGRLARYDVATNAVSVIAASHAGVAPSDLDPVMAYHPALDAVLFGYGRGGTMLYKIDSAGTVSHVLTGMPASVPGICPDFGNVLAPDPLGRSYAWLFDQYATGTRHVWRLNLSTWQWTDVGALPASFATYQSGVVATVPEIGVHLMWDPNVAVDRVWIYKPT